MISSIACALTLACTSAARLPPLDNEIRAGSQVDRKARPMADRPLPRFPSIMRSAGVGGEVRVQYVIDASGHAMPGSLVIVQSSHELFAYAVRGASPKWVFEPAQLHGRRVAVRYEEVFEFRAPPTISSSYADPKAIEYDSIAVATVVHGTTTDGVPRTVIGFRPLAPVPGGKFSGDELLAAQRAAIAAVAPGPAPSAVADTGIVTLCVSIRRDSATVPADPETLRGLIRPGRRAVVPRDCPHTYQSMVHELDTAGRPTNLAPPGWIDPWGIRITRVEGWARDLVRVWGEVGQGTGVHGFVCRVRRARSAWTAECQSLWFRVS